MEFHERKEYAYQIVLTGDEFSDQCNMKEILGTLAELIPGEYIGGVKLSFLPPRRGIREKGMVQWEYSPEIYIKSLQE